MRKIIFLITLLIAVGVSSTAFGQVASPLASDYAGQEGCKVVNLAESGKLKSLIDKKDLNSIRVLVITGKQLAVKDLEFIAKMPSLEVLDVSNAFDIDTWAYKGKPIATIKELVLPSSKIEDIVERHRVKKEDKYKDDMAQLEKLSGLFVGTDKTYQYVKLFPNLEKLLLRDKTSLALSFPLPKKVYVMNLGEWRGAIINSNTILYEKKSVSTDFKGYGLISAYLVEAGMEGDLSQAICINLQAFSGDRCPSKVFIPKSVRYIGYDVYRSGVDNVEFEEGDSLLYIGQSAFGKVENKEIVFNRPVYISSAAFVRSVPDLIVFNKDVEYIGENAFGDDEESIKKIIFKKAPKKLARCGYNEGFIRSYDKSHMVNVDIIEIPAGTESTFTAFGIPSYKLYEQGGKGLALNIQLQKPNTILSVLPVDKLSQIDSLTITGFLYETDFKALEGCKNMRYLDLSRTYITYSPEKASSDRARNQYLSSLFSFMGVAADAKYNDYRMSTLDHAYVKGFAKLMEQSFQVTKADKGCIIPSDALQNMMKLETVILPTRASSIGRMAFKNCKSLKNVKLPPFLAVIGSGAFYGCISLEQIDFPATLTSIGRPHEELTGGEGSFVKTGLKVFDLSKCRFEPNYSDFMWYFVFADMKNLKEIRFPSGVPYIEGSGPGKMTFFVPATVKTLNFGGNSNDGSIFHFSSSTPPDISYSSLRNCTLYIPKGSTTAYYAKYGSSNKYIEE